MKKGVSIIIIFVLIFIGLEISKELKLRNKLTVVFCDVGQGDGAFIRTPTNQQILIDTGSGLQILDCISSNMPFWDRKLDLIILSHFNLDHVGGIVDILSRYKVQTIAIPTQNTEREDVNNYMSLFKSNNVEINDLNNGDIYRIKNSVSIKTIGPEFDNLLVEENDASLVQILTYKDFEVLFTGDASFGVLNPLIGGLGNSIEILKVPHHGSKTGLDNSSFKSFKPKIAVISSGKGNSYGHPAREILDLLEKNNIQIRRTDQEGSIKFILD